MRGSRWAQRRILRFIGASDIENLASAVKSKGEVAVRQSVQFVPGWHWCHGLVVSQLLVK